METENDTKKIMKYKVEYYYTVHKTSKKVIAKKVKPRKPRRSMMLKFFGGVEDEAKKPAE